MPPWPSQRPSPPRLTPSRFPNQTRAPHRERSFSADASHQLRTPLTGLRLELETALLDASCDREAAMLRALVVIDRLESTVDGLLCLARDTAAPRSPLDVETLLATVERTWNGPLAREGRKLIVTDTSDGRRPPVSSQAVDQVLDVLVSNALDHGRGTVKIIVRPAGNGVAIDVTDEGVFERRSGPSPTRGIGLALARSLAEAEGGKLQLQSAKPPCFTLLLPPPR